MVEAPLAARQAAPGALSETAARIFHAAAEATDSVSLLRHVLPLAVQALGGEYLALVQGEKGRWRTLAASGPERGLPSELLAEALDKDQPVARGEWFAAPPQPRLAAGELFVAHRVWSPQLERSGALENAIQWLSSGLDAVRRREHDKQQIARLSALLEISADWTQTLEMDKLLVRMAQAATKLLKAERASIFLWDRRTRTLLCVPLRGRTGELLGAFEVVNKIGGNFSADDEQALADIAGHATVALENSQQWEQLLAAQKQIADAAEQGVQLIGESPAIGALRSTIDRVANTDLAVLILGENGTGKEVVAQMIHYRSRRRHEPLVAVNCAAITETLLESELFGHEKGAFTDAREMRRGKFELAAHGTLFLDEIGDMSLGGQAKLLRVLEEKIIVRVGGSTPIPTDARVIAATNQNLAELVRARRFREDLYFRLNVVTLDLPPLRERGEDVILLAEHFLKHFAARARRRTPKFTAAARKRLLAHDWPGNVRELRNLMERLAYLAPEDQDKIDAPDLAFILSPGSDASGALSLDLPLAEATREFQTQYIKRHIDRTRGNITAAAEKLGLHRSNLYRKMRQLGMEGAGAE